MGIRGRRAVLGHRAVHHRRADGAVVSVRNGRLRRLEARTVVSNGRANGALQKLGAVQEGRLRQGFCAEGRCYDQYLWSILANEWNPLALTSGRFH